MSLPHNRKNWGLSCSINKLMSLEHIPDVEVRSFWEEGMFPILLLVYLYK